MGRRTVLDVLDTSMISSHAPGGGGGDVIEDRISSQVDGGSGCGGKLVRTFYCRNCGNELTVGVTCGDRTCPDCRRKEGRRLKARYYPFIKQVPRAKLALVTLTLRLGPGDKDLRGRVERIRRLWRKLIRQSVWRPVVGGLYVIECKWSSRYEGAWNVHIHALAEGGAVIPFKYQAGGQEKTGAEIHGPGGVLRPQALMAAWRKLSSDSFVVDMQPVRTEMGARRGALSYLLKYLTKPGNWPSRAARVAYNVALHRTRLVHTFGRWHPMHKLFRWADLLAKRVFKKSCGTCGQEDPWISEWEYHRLAWQAGVLNEPAPVRLDDNPWADDPPARRPLRPVVLVYLAELMMNWLRSLSLGQVSVPAGQS